MNSITGRRTTTRFRRAASSIAVVGLLGFGLTLFFIGLHREVKP
jgi:hypothetical protein